MKHPVDIIGATDVLDLPELGWYQVPVRIDSGATTSAIHCARVRVVKEGGENVLRFYLDAKKGAPQQSYAVTDYTETIVRNSSGKEEKRYVIKTPIIIFGKKIRTSFSLANRGKMRYPILLGRTLLKGRFLIDVSKKDLSFHWRTKKKPTTTASKTKSDSDTDHHKDKQI